MTIDPAACIDHTILKQTTTWAEVEKICDEAIEENFAAICLPPKYVTDARKLLNNSAVKLATVIGFPLGNVTLHTKLFEIREALANGADEVDMVIDLCALKNDDWTHLEKEITTCLKPVKEAGKVIKLIVESGILTDDELLACCVLYSKYDIDYMKTSTGYADKGASVHAVRLMRANLPGNIKIKASGGIRNYAFAKELMDAGATRLGCSASMEIMKEYRLLS